MNCIAARVRGPSEERHSTCGMYMLRRELGEPFRGLGGESGHHLVRAKYGVREGGMWMVGEDGERMGLWMSKVDGVAQPIGQLHPVGAGGGK